MEVETRQTKAKDAASRWHRQYWNNLSLKFKHNGLTAGDINTELVKISQSDNPDPDLVDALIGNASWTMPNPCSECGASGVPVIRLGEEPDVESETAWVCRECLAKAMELLASVIDEPEAPEPPVEGEGL